MFSSIQPILNERVDNIYGIESALYSNHLGLAGRCDCIAEFDARPSIIDFKTSTRLKKKEWIEDYFLQTACYAVMFEERTNIPIPNLVIIIAVENESPQIFIEKRDTWIGEAIDVIAGYNAAQWLAGEDID
jgi:genome maintenance exonuclease 1